MYCSPQHLCSLLPFALEFPGEVLPGKAAPMPYMVWGQNVGYKTNVSQSVSQGNGEVRTTAACLLKIVLLHELFVLNCWIRSYCEAVTDCCYFFIVFIVLF
jgi:hypothetical protein